MIILKNTKNTQTFYVSKKCGIESGQLPVGSYTKIEADERFQPRDFNLIKLSIACNPFEA